MLGGSDLVAKKREQPMSGGSGQVAKNWGSAQRAPPLCTHKRFYSFTPFCAAVPSLLLCALLLQGQGTGRALVLFLWVANTGAHHCA